MYNSQLKIPAHIIPAQVKRETPDYRLTIEGWEYAVTKMPDMNCKHRNCYGRGWTGADSKTRQPMLCKCVGYWELLHEPKGGETEDGPPDENNR